MTDTLTPTQADAPDIRLLWQSRSKARKYYRCDRCGGEIAPGEQYESLGLIEDGDFRHERMHVGANYYPSGCPTIGARDDAELAGQFELDRQLFGDRP